MASTPRLRLPKQGDPNHAVHDYSELIQLDPKNANAYFSHGIANLYAGALPKALADLDQSNALDPKDPYRALWFDIVAKHSKVMGRLGKRRRSST